jgi:hypothetical protein
VRTSVNITNDVTSLGKTNSETPMNETDDLNISHSTNNRSMIIANKESFMTISSDKTPMIMTNDETPINEIAMSLKNNEPPMMKKHNEASVSVMILEKHKIKKLTDQTKIIDSGDTHIALKNAKLEIIDELQVLKVDHHELKETLMDSSDTARPNSNTAPVTEDHCIKEEVFDKTSVPQQIFGFLTASSFSAQNMQLISLSRC